MLYINDSNILIGATVTKVKHSMVGRIDEICVVKDGINYSIFEGLEVVNRNEYKKVCFKCPDMVRYTNGYFICDKTGRWINPEDPECRHKDKR